MKKILILGNNSSGLCNFRLELIQKLVKLGYDVFFCVPEDGSDLKVQQLIGSGANYIQTIMDRRGMDFFNELSVISSYKKIMKRIDPDIILSFTIKPNIYGAYVANKFAKPIIINITGLGSAFNNLKILPFIKLMYKNACKNAYSVFFQNVGNHEYFIKNNLVSDSKTILLPGSGVNIERFIPEKMEKKDTIVRFLFIGRIMKEKGIEEYLSAAECIKKKFKDTEFLILGAFEEKIYENRLLNNTYVKYLGVSNDVREYIKYVDCVVNPSYHEGMSNVLLESAAMGKPLIASNIFGCKEIVDENQNGFLFEVGNVKDLVNKLELFISLDNAKIELMGKVSRNIVVKRFDRNIVINSYIEKITSVLK
ncbi:MAG: glycosyltransferase family 4 protein [Planctomycetes bacterium]|nr:glycosyltransferase family 4 protein [Planctomycetota bacterium]